MQKVFQETFRSENYNTLPLHHEGYAINKKFVIFKHSLKKLHLLNYKRPPTTNVPSHFNSVGDFSGFFPVLWQFVKEQYRFEQSVYKNKVI